MATRGGNGKRVQQNKRVMVTNPNIPSPEEMETLSGCVPNPQTSKRAAGTSQARSHSSSPLSRAAPPLVTPTAPMFVHGNPLEEDDTTVVELPPKKRGRGKTTNQVIAKLSRHEKIDLELSADMRAIGVNSAKFANFLGPLVRCTQFVPVQVENWSKMEDLGINASLFKMTCEAFNIPPEQLENARWLVEHTASTAWRNHLYAIKKNYYNVHKTDAARFAAKPPPNMTKTDWEFLIKKFGSEDHKAISERNSSNRSKAVLKHTSGSVSHAKVFDDETKKNGGVAPGMLDFYTKVHTHKDGTPADVESERIITEANEEIAHQEEENADPVNKDRIFQLVKE